MVTLADLETRVIALEQGPPVQKCSALAPHISTQGSPGLVWSGSDYLCTLCLNKYIKKPPGGLQLVVEVIQ